MCYSPMFKSLHFSPAGHRWHHPGACWGWVTQLKGWKLLQMRYSNGCLHFLSVLALLLICISITRQLDFRKTGLSSAESLALSHSDKHLKQKHFCSYTLVQWHPEAHTQRELHPFTSSLILYLIIFSNLQKTHLHIQWNQVQAPLPAVMSEIFL